MHCCQTCFNKARLYLDTHTAHNRKATYCIIGLRITQPTRFHIKMASDSPLRRARDYTLWCRVARAEIAGLERWRSCRKTSVTNGFRKAPPVQEDSSWRKSTETTKTGHTSTVKSKTVLRQQQAYTSRLLQKSSCKSPLGWRVQQT